MLTFALHYHPDCFDSYKMRKQLEQIPRDQVNVTFTNVLEENPLKLKATPVMAIYFDDNFLFKHSGLVKDWNGLLVMIHKKVGSLMAAE